jgi:nucleoporin NUP42
MISSALNIAQDLTPNKEKPLWPLSSYAPSKHEPLLLPGLDESPEELRVKAFTALKAGNINEYVSLGYYFHRMIPFLLCLSKASIRIQQDISRRTHFWGTHIKFTSHRNSYHHPQNARNNSEQAYQQAVKNSKLPALIADATKTTSAFGTPSGSAFPSAFGNNTTTTNPIPSAFGNTTTTTTTSPSAFGTTTSTPSAFGKPSAFGQPAFGQTSTPTATGAFGQPLNSARPVSAFSSQSAFGQPAQGAPASAFGQTSTPSSVIKPATTGAFSAFAGTPSPFGATANSAATTTPAAAGAGGGGGGFSSFAGQPSAFGLGAPGSTNTQGSVFGQTAFGQPTNATPAAAGTTSVFGTPAQGSGSVFGAPSAFGAQQQGAFGLGGGGGGGGTTTSAFNANPAGTTSVFGQNAFSSIPSNPTLSVFPSTNANMNTNNNSREDPMSTTPIPQTNSNATLTAFTQPTPSISMEMKTPTTSSSSTLDFTPSNPRLNAKGAYKPGSTPYDQQLPVKYGEMLPKKVVEAFRAVKFEWGGVPEWVPPLDVR